MEDCKRDFPIAAVIGGAGESVLSRLTNGRAGITEMHYLDHSPVMLNRARYMQQVTGASLDVLPRLDMHNVQIQTQDTFPALMSAAFCVANATQKNSNLPLS